MGNKNKIEARRKADWIKRWGLRFIFPGIALLVLGFLFIDVSSIFIGIMFVGIILTIIGGAIYSFSETWEKGAEGEEKVIEELKKLGGDYEVFNDLVLPGESSNIDHVVVSKYGVFVVETKNLDGLIECKGDSWSRTKIGRKGTPYPGGIGSPSKQVKSNAVKLKKFLEKRHLEIFIEKDLYFEGIVVFSNPNAEIEVINPTVKVVELDNLNKTLLERSRGILDSKEVSKIRKSLRGLGRN